MVQGKNEPDDSLPGFAYYYSLAKSLQRMFDPGTVFDIGCASGALVSAFLRLGCTAWGCDIRQECLSQAQPEVRTRLLNLDITEARSPFEDGTFDLITMIDVTEHLNSLAWTTEVNRLLKSDGHLYISTPSPISLLAARYRDPTHVNVRGKKSWIRLLNCYGLSLVRDLPKEERTKALAHLGGNSLTDKLVLAYCRWMANPRSDLIFQKP